MPKCAAGYSCGLLDAKQHLWRSCMHDMVFDKLHFYTAVDDSRSTLLVCLMYFKTHAPTHAPTRVNSYTTQIPCTYRRTWSNTHGCVARIYHSLLEVCHSRTYACIWICICGQSINNNLSGFVHILNCCQLSNCKKCNYISIIIIMDIIIYITSVVTEYGFYHTSFSINLHLMA